MATFSLRASRESLYVPKVRPCSSVDIEVLPVFVRHDRGRAGPLRYLAVSHAFTALWLLRMTDREKNVEILALQPRLAVLQRQIGDQCL
ncbi:hypothetical protein [Lentzea kentuckyensis]|uniref:hypothetical protein n=1 Tax=Lentzea kentuckyensis TaxID=360086 RepID=UPI00117A2EAD|nr:hypothetical protein [Lentzea kentuckyensis]